MQGGPSRTHDYEKPPRNPFLFHWLETRLKVVRSSAPPWGLVGSYGPRGPRVGLFGSGVTKRAFFASPNAQERVRADRSGPRFARGKRAPSDPGCTRTAPIRMEMAGSCMDPDAVMCAHL